MKKTPKQQNQGDMNNMNSELNSVESSPATTPVHYAQNEMLTSTISNSYNSMDIQSPSNRNLSEKELRDCDVIGINIVPIYFMINSHQIFNSY